MIVIPAIDIRAGNCVRLAQGRLEQEVIYAHDPVVVAEQWRAQGARRLHIVDLDGAFAGSPQNQQVIERIRAAVTVPLEVGGGIRSDAALAALFDGGIDYCVFGTAAVRDPEFLARAVARYGEKIIVAIDAVKQQVAVKGWTDVTGVSVQELALRLEALGVREVLYTDIEQDGMMHGPNMAGVKRLTEQTAMRVIISGGVSSYADLERIRAAALPTVSGVIIGRALYTRAVSLDKAIAIIENHSARGDG